MELAVKGESLLVVSKNGYGKRTPVKEYKMQSRGGKGLLTYDKTKFDKTGVLIGAISVVPDDEVFLINSDGIIIRISAGEVSELGRSTQGVRIMKVEGDTEIVTLARAPREDALDEEPEKPAPEKNGKAAAKGAKEAKAEKSAKAGKGSADTDPEKPEDGDQLSLL
jgi:DNA gyrase subunit A